MNKLKNKYRVVKNTYFEKCDVKNEEYIIEYYKKTWYGYRWTSVKELVMGWGDMTKQSIRFKTEAEAVFAIKKLEMGNLPDGWKQEVVCELNFNKVENK